MLLYDASAFCESDNPTKTPHIAAHSGRKATTRITRSYMFSISNEDCKPRDRALRAENVRAIDRNSPRRTLWRFITIAHGLAVTRNKLNAYQSAVATSIAYYRKDTIITPVVHEHSALGLQAVYLKIDANALVEHIGDASRYCIGLASARARERGRQ